MQTSHEFTISQLSAETGVTIRNIRAYRARGLLPAPEKRGRYGIYSDAHVARLQVIGELLERGYAIANIAELLDAWESGAGLKGLLGLETAILTPFKKEIAREFSVLELKSLFGKHLTPANIKRAVDMRLLRVKGVNFIAHRPDIIEVGSQLCELGIGLHEILNILTDLRGQLDAASDVILNVLDHEIFADYGDAMPPAHKHSELAQTVWQLRELMDRALLSELGESLNTALKHRFGERLLHTLDAV